MPKNADTPMFVKVAGKVIVFNVAILSKELAPTETQALSSAKSTLYYKLGFNIKTKPLENH